MRVLTHPVVWLIDERTSGGRRHGAAVVQLVSTGAAPRGHAATILGSLPLTFTSLVLHSILHMITSILAGVISSVLCTVTRIQNHFFTSFNTESSTVRGINADTDLRYIHHSTLLKNNFESWVKTDFDWLCLWH